jgi:hypothetical protein
MQENPEAGWSHPSRGFCSEEMFMRTCLAIVLFSFISCVVAIPQSAPVAPPPKPADDNPTLEATMHTIEIMLNEVGPISYSASWQNHADNTSGSNQFKVAATDVEADAAGCKIAYHWLSVRDGQPARDSDYWFSLAAVREVVVRSGDEHLKKVNEDAGQQQVVAHVDPPHWVVVLRRGGRSENVFVFKDEVMANRVARALLHAVDMCGGGKKDEPF